MQVITQILMEILVRYLIVKSLIVHEAINSSLVLNFFIYAISISNIDLIENILFFCNRMVRKFNNFSHNYFTLHLSNFYGRQYRNADFMVDNAGMQECNIFSSL